MSIQDRRLLDLTYELILQLDSDGRIQGANLPVSRMLGYSESELIGTPFLDLVAEESRDECLLCLETAQNLVPVGGSHLTVVGVDERTLPVEARFEPRAEGATITTYAFLLSLTEQQQVRRALRESEQQLRTVLSTVPDVILVLDSEGQYRQVYTANDESLVAPKESLLGRKVEDVVSTEEAIAGLRIVQSVIRENRPINTEYSLLIHGKTKWFSARVVPFGTAEDPCVLWVARDITDLVLARRKLQDDEQLLRRLLRLETKSREVVAYEIHDGFVQYAVGTQMWLQHAMDQIDELPEETAMAIRISVESINRAVEDARGMIGDLRPVVLEEEGLVSGLRQLVDVMQQKTNIPIEFECLWDPPPMLSLLESQVFRIVQESLNNVIRHSQATQAFVRLNGGNEEIQIAIVDNGCGFDLQTVGHDRFGLEGIQRRASVFGGSARITTAHQRGTTILVTLPVLQPDGSVDESVMVATSDPPLPSQS